MSKKEKTRELTDMQKAFLGYLVNEAGGDLKLAKQMAGYSDNTTVPEIVEALSDEIVDVTIKNLSANAPKAMMALLEVLRDPSSFGASNKIKAATEILNRAGAAKRTEGDVNLRLPEGGVVILPAKDLAVVSMEESDNG